jgi:hypothetical protein
MDQLQFAIESADAEVMHAMQNLGRVKRYAERFPRLGQAASLMATAEQRVYNAVAEVARLEALEQPLTGHEALRYWQARERRDDEDTADITAMIRRYAARLGN